MRDHSLSNNVGPIPVSACYVWGWIWTLPSHDLACWLVWKFDLWLRKCLNASMNLFHSRKWWITVTNHQLSSLKKISPLKKKSPWVWLCISTRKPHVYIHVFTYHFCLWVWYFNVESPFVYKRREKINKIKKDLALQKWGKNFSLKYLVIYSQNFVFMIETIHIINQYVKIISTKNQLKLRSFNHRALWKWIDGLSKNIINRLSICYY